MIDAVLGAFEAALTFLHDIMVPVFGDMAWGWAIIALTLVVRIGLLPLAIKQTRSMRAMQALQPQIKELQKKYKVDRDLLRKDPELYKSRKQQLSQEQMALFQREGANPMASCLPLLAQAPIFLALFYTLRGQSAPGEPLFAAPFYFFTDFITQTEATDPTGLAATVANAGWPGWLLILLMSGSLFFSQKQMMARNAAQMADNPMAQQQKILLYVMPIFLAVISFQFPLGILLYWVTTNLWQVAQQAIILREVKHEVEAGTLADKPGGEAARKGKRTGKGGKGKGGKGAAAGPAAGDASGPKGSKGGKGTGSASSGKRSPGATSGGGKPAADPGTNGTGGDRPKGGSKRGKGAAGDGGSSGRADNGASGATGGDRSTKRDHIPRRGGGSRG